MGMERLEFTSTQEMRLDIFLTETTGKDFSRSFWQKLIKDGHVQVNGKIVSKVGYKLSFADLVSVEYKEPAKPTVKAEEIPLDILYEDDDILVINKSRGMVVHPAPGNYSGTLVNALLAYLPDWQGIKGTQRPGIVHRLDKDTTGLLVVAKNDQSLFNLARQIKDREVTREYLALVRGVPPVEKGLIDAPIGRHPVDRKKMAVIPGKGRPARTHFTLEESFGDRALLRLKLDTGRTHQIRVHLAYIGYPVLGDETYGKKEDYTGQLLHARRLAFKHPQTNEELEFTVELPKDFQEVLRGLRK